MQNFSTQKDYLGEYDFPFLSPINFDKEWDRTSVVVNQYPWLNFSGYFTSEDQQYRHDYQIVSPNMAYQHWLQKQQPWDSRFWNTARYLDQVHRARYWLSQLRIESPDCQVSSYELKDFCRDWWQVQAWAVNTTTSCYITNGALMVAAFSLGWEITDNHTALNKGIGHFQIEQASFHSLMLGVRRSA